MNVLCYAGGYDADKVVPKTFEEIAQGNGESICAQNQPQRVGP